MKLHKLHILKRQAGTDNHGRAVAGAGVRRGCREIGAPVTAGCQNNLLGLKTVNGAVLHAHGRHANAAVFVHNQIKREIFDKKLSIVAQRLTIQRVQNGVAGAVGRRAGALGNAFAEIRRHAAKGTLINFAFLRARKRHAEMLQFVNGFGRIAAQIFNGVLVAQPVRAFDGVIHVPAPVIITHIAKRGGYAPLRGNRVAARRKDFRNTCRFQPALGTSQCGAQSGTAGPDNDNIKLMIGKFICTHDTLLADLFYWLTTSFKTASAHATPIIRAKKLLATSAASFVASP